MHGARGDLRRGDGVDEQARAVGDIAAGEDVGRGGLVGLAIHLDQAALAFDAVGRVEERKVGSLADGEDDAVGGDVFHLALVERGIEAARGIEHRGAASRCASAVTFRPPSTIARGPRRLCSRMPSSAPSMHFDLVGRHFVAALQADYVDFFVAAQAQRRAGHVVGHLLAASISSASCGRFAGRPNAPRRRPRCRRRSPRCACPAAAASRR